MDATTSSAANDRRGGDLSFDIIEPFLIIYFPFESLLLFQQQIDQVYDVCVVSNKYSHKIYFSEE
jgi:hypothetical protein